MNRTLWTVLVAATVGVSTLASAQVRVQPAPRAPARDVAPREPNTLRIPIGTASICGSVTTAEGRPVSGARVVVQGQAESDGPSPEQLTRSVLTDASGAFAFPRMPSGSFTAYISAGNAHVNYGQRRPGGRGQILRLADGQKVTLTIAMPRASAISGVVFGPNGDPQENTSVRAFRYDTSNGFRRLIEAGFARTDDRGRYRIFSMQPGDYIISALLNYGPPNLPPLHEVTERTILAAPALSRVASTTIPNSDLLAEPAPWGYLPTYAPSAMAPEQAMVITVAGGEERLGVDIQTQFVSASAVQGVVQTPLDADVKVQLWMQNNDPLADPSSGRGTMPDEQGKFTIGGVPPGDYTIYAHTVLAPQNATHDGVQRQLTDAQRMWGRVRVSARGERTVSVNVTLQPSRSISGVVVFDMKTPPDLTRSQWTVNAVNPPMTQNYYRSGGQPNAVVKPDGRFTLTGVPAGQYMLRASSGTMKSSLVSGQETLDFPLEFTGDRDVTDAVLTVADRANNLNGTLTDASGAPAPNYTVVVAATDTRFWTPGSRRIRFSYPDFNGRYSFYDLPPGSYQLAVVTDVEPGKHYDPEFLRTIAITSVPITIADGAKVTQNLRVK